MANSNTNQVQAPSHEQSRSFSLGPVAIFWDIENCPIPSDVHPEDVASNIITALLVQRAIKEAVTIFSAYGDFNAFPRQLREGLQRTGVKLIDVPNGRKDVADKAIIVDMFLFALDNPPPSSIMLIFGDVDFARALHVLNQREYTVIPVIPFGVGVSSAPSNAGRFMLDWPSVARGGPHDIAGSLMAFYICDNPDGQNEEVLARSSSSGDQNDSTLWVQPGDLNGLKGQLVKLLELSGGCLPLSRVPAKYQKNFWRPLRVSNYRAFKLVDLFEKMGDSMVIKGKGNEKFVYLQNVNAGPSAPQF